MEWSFATSEEVIAKQQTDAADSGDTSRERADNAEGVQVQGGADNHGRAPVIQLATEADLRRLQI